jgi:hypothetical protein
MSGNDRNSLDDPPRKRSGAGGDLLLELATMDLFRRNAFRLTGLPVDATLREISKQGDKLILMQELGSTLDDALMKRKPAPSLDELRHALQRIRDPENRILDELFWFWPADREATAVDPAITALARGDIEEARELWGANARASTMEVREVHNLAILHHVLALDAEAPDAHTAGSRPSRAEIDAHWGKALAYWQWLVKDDRFWEAVSARVREINEPNLTTGYARHLRTALPRALNKISAEVIVTMADGGHTGRARKHLDLVEKHGNGADGVETMAGYALSPVVARLHEHIETARRRADHKPAEAAGAARDLLDHAEASLDIYTIFSDAGESRKEIFDEVASTVVDCAVDYQRKTDDNKTFVAVLERALPLAVSDEVRRRVQKNVDIGKGNLSLVVIQPVLDSLRAIRETKGPAKAIFASIQNDILGCLAKIQDKHGAKSAAANQLSDAIAIALRAVSIDAHNIYDDLETALDAITIARVLARDPELQKQIAEDFAQVNRSKQQRDQHNLKLTIRSDEIEVTHDRVRLNTTTLSAADIVGVRYGSFKQYTNGVNTSTSYLVSVASGHHGLLDIECKRWFRSEEQAQSDFQAILEALYVQIVPGLCDRLAKRIAAGGEVALGDWILSRKGMSGATGALFWKEEHQISWADVRFVIHQGQLNISSATNPKAKASFSIREAWNAAIFKELANAIVTELNRK